MNKYIVQEGQNLFDIALQNGGSIENIIDIIKQNNISITQKITAGQEIEMPENKQRTDIANYFATNNFTINTGDNEQKIKEFNNDFNNDFA